MTPKEECEQLLDAMLPFAEEQLSKFGGFYPFGAVLLTDGSIEHTAYSGGGEHPEATEVIAGLTAAHRQDAKAGRIKASAIAWDGRLRTANGGTGEAVVVSLEHRAHYSVVVAEPYKKRPLQPLEKGNMIAMAGLHEVFPEPKGAGKRAGGANA